MSWLKEKEGKMSDVKIRLSFHSTLFGCLAYVFDQQDTCLTLKVTRQNKAL